MRVAEPWRPPGKNCGLCGDPGCKEFMLSVINERKTYADCPFYRKEQSLKDEFEGEAAYTQRDALGHLYDFVLSPLPGEISARKIVLPFRADLVERMAIREGDYILGRPMGAGCPVPHVLKVIGADPATGLLETWVAGPRAAREREIKDVKAYHMIGFEGVAESIRREPAFGYRVTFLPGFCMMNINHTGLVNMLLKKSCGLHVRIEDIRILAGPDE